MDAKAPRALVATEELPNPSLIRTGMRSPVEAGHATRRATRWHARHPQFF